MQGCLHRYDFSATISGTCMKTDIHPTYFPKATMKCACGTVYHMGSTKENLEIEICAHCHPYYTGKEKLIDTAGRVDKFRKRMTHAQPKKAKKTSKKIRK